MDILSEMYEIGMSIPEIADELELPRSSVRNKLLKRGVKLRSRADAVRAAARDGKLGSAFRGKKRSFSKEHCENISKGRVLWGKANARGTSVKPSGYVEYTTGVHKGRLVHVVAMEEMIGRKLKPNECVHHIDECKTNNEISNLALMTRSAHAKLHRMLDAERGIIRERNENGRFS